MGKKSLLLILAVVLVAGVALLAASLEGARGRRVLAGSEPAAADLPPAELTAPEADRPHAPETEEAGEHGTAGRVAIEGLVDPLAAETAEVDDLAFERDALYGTVLHDLDEPVAGARVLAFRLRSSIWDDPEPVGEDETDAAGRFRIRGLAPLEKYKLYVEAAATMPYLDDAWTGTEVEVELAEASFLAGHVLDDETDRGLEGVIVAWRQTHWDGEAFARYRRVTTDAAGLFRAEPVKVEDSVTLTASRPGFVPCTDRFKVIEEGRSDCNIPLVAGLTVSGEVFDVTTGNTLPDVELRWGDELLATTDATGRFTITQAPVSSGLRQRNTMSAVLAGYCETIVHWNAKQLEVAGTARIPMMQGATIEGTVRDPEGTPIEGARISVLNQTRDYEGQPGNHRPDDVSVTFRSGDAASSVFSDVQGHYEVGELVPGARGLQLLARHDDYVDESVQDLELENPGEHLTLDVVLEAGASIHGVVFVDDEPSSARVVCKSSGSATTFANDRGEYRFDGVEPGEVELTAHAEVTRWSRGTNAQETFTIEAGESIEQDLHVEADLEPIRGHVVTASGGPVAGANVGAWARDRAAGIYVRANTKSDEEGAFEMEVPAATGVRFTVSANDGQRNDSERDVPAGATDLVLVLPDPGLLRLAVYDGLTRETVEGYDVYWKPQSESEYQRTWTRGGTMPGPDGVVEFELAAGTIDVAVSARNKGYRSVELTGIRIGEDEGAPPVEVPLVAGTTLRVHITGEKGPDPWGHSILLLAEGQPVPGNRWGGYPESDVWSFQNLEPNKHGVARARGMTPGTYRLVSVPKGLVIEPAKIEVPEQDVAEFSLTWKFSEAEKKKQAKGVDAKTRSALIELGYD